MPSGMNNLNFSNSCYLKNLEEPYVYNVLTDELYILDDEGFEILKLFHGNNKKAKPLKYKEELIKYCLEEGILTEKNELKRFPGLEKSPVPSLRYLELYITEHCNLDCIHCFLGSKSQIHLGFEKIKSVIEEFENMQGLRLILTGGEPLLHPDFWRINDIIGEYAIRTIMLSNGTLITEDIARRLNVNEVQISLDGWEDSHEVIRGAGTFQKTISAIEKLKNSGITVSIATMIHSENLDDFEILKTFMEDFQIREWNVETPCLSGNLVQNSSFLIKAEIASHYMKYGFGGGLYESAPGFACGAHLCAVMPDGSITKCAYYADNPAGCIEEGLRTCWKRIKPIPLKALKCECPYLEKCRGGCRFRAQCSGDIYSPDPVMCQVFGYSPKIII